MKVITMPPDALAEGCLELRRRFEACYGEPALTIGIARGGLHVARLFISGEPLAELLSRRSLTAAKKSRAAGFLARLPRPATDALRIAESIFYGLTRRLKKDRQTPFALPDNVREALSRLPAGVTVAVVDDAADSGDTLRRIRNAVSLCRPDVEVRTAVITVTRPEADDAADVALWRDRTLVRFPWSADFPPHTT